MSLSETTFGAAALRGRRGVGVGVGVAVAVAVGVLRATGGSFPLPPHWVPIRYSAPSSTTTPSTTTTAPDRTGPRRRRRRCAAAPGLNGRRSWVEGRS